MQSATHTPAPPPAPPLPSLPSLPAAADTAAQKSCRGTSCKGSWVDPEFSVYVGNLDPDTSLYDMEELIYELFLQVGAVFNLVFYLVTCTVTGTWIVCGIMGSPIGGGGGEGSTCFNEDICCVILWLCVHLPPLVPPAKPAKHPGMD